MVDAFYSRHKAHLTLGLAIAVGLAIVAFAGIAFYVGKSAPPTQTTSATSPAASRSRPSFVRLPARRFGDWTLSCILGLHGGGQECALTFNAVDKSRKHLLLRMSVAKTAKGPAMIVLAPPTGVRSAGFSFTPDKGETIAVPYVRCLPGVCETAFIINDAIATSLKTAQGAQVKFMAGQQPVSFRIPMAGFSDGYAAWIAQQPERTPAAAKTAPALAHRAAGPPPGSAGKVPTQH